LKVKRNNLREEAFEELNAIQLEWYIGDLKNGIE